MKSPDFKNRYIHEFGFLDDDSNNSNNSKYTRQEYKDLILESHYHLFDNYVHLNKEQNCALMNIYNCTKTLDDLLEPIRNFRIPYELGISGGALYDFLTNNSQSTKDIDLILYFPISTDKEPKDINNFPIDDSDQGYRFYLKSKPKKDDWINDSFQNNVHQFIKNYFPNLAMDDLELVYDMEIFSNCVSQLISQQYTSRIYNNKSFNKTKYVNMLLHRLIKIKDTNLPKPMDIMIAKNNIQTYCSAFDFEICKNYIIYRNFEQKPTYKKFNDIFTEITQNPTISIASLLLEHMICFPSAVLDFTNKKLTMKLNSVRLKDVDYYMNKHYPRLKEKLPDYNLDFLTSEENMHIAQYYKSREAYNKLQQHIPEKNNDKAKLKL